MRQDEIRNVSDFFELDPESVTAEFPWSLYFEPAGNGSGPCCPCKEMRAA